MPGRINEDTLILVMGMTGAGKTTFINKASGSNLVVGGGLESCTSEVQAGDSFLLDGRVVTLIDSPGFDDTHRSEAEILREVTGFLAKTYEGGRLLAGVLYLHRITDRRVGGVAKRNFSVFRRLCGESTLKNAVIVTNMWTANASGATLAEEEARETELASNEAFFKRALDNGARMTRHNNTTESAHAIIRQFFTHEPAPLLIQRELVDDNKRLVATDAGSHMKDELSAMSERYRKEIEEIEKARREQEEALRAANAQMMQQMTTAESRYLEEMKGFRGVIEQLTNELKETREALSEERKKVRNLEEQVQLLTQAGEGLNKKVDDTARKVEEDIRKVKRQQQRRSTAPADYNPRAYRRASEDRTSSREKDLPNPQPSARPQVSSTHTQDEPAWCVVM